MASNGSSPDFSHIKPLLLDMARERSHTRLLRLVVDRLAGVRNIALGRIWLVDDDAECALCQDSGNPGPGHLHPVALELDPSLGARVRGEHLPVAHIALRPTDPRYAAWIEGLVAEDLHGDPRWRWAADLGGLGVASQPLMHRDELLGVIEVVTWTAVAAEGPSWLRIIADHAAAAIANSRAFAEIERLQRHLAEENQHLQEEICELQWFGGIVGTSRSLRSMLDEVELVAPTDSTVLILGESGTGKELVAREVHARSRRADQPLIRVNCASIPGELYESEFFGHVRGAFTGAMEDRAGRFELADGGTLFLDEVGELPIDMQAKLLRVLQEGQYERVGEGRTREVDVRIVAATNRDLEREVEAGNLRQDLFYRLNVFPVTVPPLRERPGDIPLLARHFVELFAGKLKRPLPRISEAALDQLTSYNWPGNVRELQNVVERALILARDGVLVFDLPVAQERGARARAGDGASEDSILLQAEIERLELRNMELALQRARGKVSGPGGAAELLGMKPSTLASRIRRLGAIPASAERSAPSKARTS